MNAMQNNNPGAPMPQAPQNAPHPLPQTPADAMPHNGYAPQPPMTAAPMPYPDGAPMGGQSLALQGIDLVMDYNTSASGNPAATQPAAWQMGQPLALNHANFQLGEGERVAIMGPSGSGKSTLLHILGGVDRPTSGHVYMNGEDVYSRSDTALAIFRRREVGLIYQFYNLIPVLNVVENITLPVLMDGRKVNDARLQELLNTLGLRGREKHLPNQLSGGQQQRVSIGRALINAPSVVLADEPTGNLDRKNSQEIVELLKYSNRQYGQTLIVITHDESIALQADRVLAIEDGHIVRDEVIRK